MTGRWEESVWAGPPPICEQCCRPAETGEHWQQVPNLMWQFARLAPALFDAAAEDEYLWFCSDDCRVAYAVALMRAHTPGS